MAAADREAIAAGVCSFDLMTAAGRAVARRALTMLGGGYGKRVAILCGKGANGGDGLIAARFLAHSGVHCSVLLLDGKQILKQDSARAFADITGVACITFPESLSDLHLERCNLVIDAIVGTGFRGILSGPAESAILSALSSGLPILSVDIPSGINGATGEAAGPVVTAAVTVTLAAHKPGLLLEPGASHAGRVEVADIGISTVHLKSDLFLIESYDAAAALKPRNPDANKRSVGKVLIVAGSFGMAGAACLAAQGALRSGAGLVWMAVPRSITAQVHQSAIEAIIVPLPETPTGAISADGVDTVLALAKEVDCVALGPGLRRGAETADFVRSVVFGVGCPLVLDADGIAAFDGHPEDISGRENPLILTPHSGELARLTKQDFQEIDRNRLDSARTAARLTGGMVLLKGRPTLVAEPTGRAAIVTTGSPVLASGGTGDVLTGMIAALGASSDLMKAACSAAWIHGEAGALLARRIGNRGILASDVARTIPAIIGGLVA